MYYIQHSGIKGQRKGVRRFQYANKSYTPEGNRRYRPSKGGGDGSGAAIAGAAIGVGALGAAYAGSGLLSGSGSAAAASAALTAAITAGKAAVAAIPAGVWALSIPMAIIATPLMLDRGERYYKKFKEKMEDKWWF